MANQVSNNNVNMQARTSRFDSDRLLPNGAMPTRNGVKGQSLGRIVRSDAAPQDTFEHIQNTPQHSTYNSTNNSTSNTATATNTAKTTQASQATGTTQTNQVTQSTANSGRKTVQDVLDTLRGMMPGWTISTSTADWGEGFRNIQIDHSILQRMAEDPAEMERIKSMILEFEAMVPKLEQWQQQNPGQSLILSILMDADGNTSGLATIKTLLGVERSNALDLSGDKSSWVENFHQAIEALTQESRTWTA